jgi:hypothetical protein
LDQDEGLHHRLNKAIAEFPVSTDLLQNAAAIWLAQAFEVLARRIRRSS